MLLFSIPYLGHVVAHDDSVVGQLLVEAFTLTGVQVEVELPGDMEDMSVPSFPISIKSTELVDARI